MLRVLTGTTLRAALAGTLLCVAGASVAAWAAPEATGTFEKIPLEKEVDDRFWFVQNQYQDNSERVRPSRKQKKGRKTSLEIVPVLMRTNLAGVRRREEALRKLGRLEPGRKLSIGGQARSYFPPYVAKVTVNGVSRYRWFAENELHGRYGLGSALFHGLEPGRHQVKFEIWGDEGEHFQGSLTIFVDDKALDPKLVANHRKRVERARRAVERMRMDPRMMKGNVVKLQKYAGLLLTLGNTLLDRSAAEPREIYPLIDEARKQAKRILTMPHPSTWKSKRETWQEFKDQEVRRFLLAEVKLLRKLGDQAALKRLPGIADQLEQVGGYAHPVYQAQAEILFALTARVEPTRDLLEQYIAERDRSVARARAQGQIFGTVFVNRKPDWPRALKGRAQPPPEEPDDGYWTWYVDYVEEKERRQQRMNEIRFELSVLAKQVREQRARWMDLLRLDMELFQAGDVLQGKAAGHRLGASTKEERNRLRAEIQKARSEQRKLMEEGLEQVRVLARSVDAQQKKSGARRNDLSVELQRLEDQEQILTLQFYDAAEWYAPHELPQLVRTMKIEQGSAPEVVKIIEAKAHLADARHLEEQRNMPSATPRNPRLDEPLVKGAITARFKALQNVREVLAQNPDHEEARAMLRQMELYWLGRIGAKLEQEKQVSLAAFGAYLEKRGYDKNERAGWWNGFKEYAWVTWSSGPISLGAGLPGVDMPWVVAEDVSITQTEIAKNLVALLAIQRLRKNGVPLEEIHRITPAELGEKMVLHTAGQKPLPENKARRMVRDIRETFAELEELRSLTDGELVEFNLAMGRSIYGSVTSDQSWGEYLGDAFSPRHLISLFGPSAIVKVGGKWVWMGRMTGSEIRAAEAAGKLMRGRDALVAGLRLEKLAESLTATRGGGWLRQKLIADHQWLTRLPGWEQFLRKGSALVGTMIILGGASHLAAESGIPGAVLLVDIIAELTGQEILFDILSRSGTPVPKLLGRLDDALEFAVKKQDHLARVGRTLDELDELAAKVQASKGKMTKETRQKLEGICNASLDDMHRRPHKGLPAIMAHEVALARIADVYRLPGVPLLLFAGSSAATGIPGCPGARAIGNAIPGSPEEAAAKAFRDVIDALQRGSGVEAKRALKAAHELNAASQKELKKLIGKFKKARQALARARQIRARAVSEQLLPINQTPAKRFADADLYGGTGGEHLLKGDELVRRGMYDKALESYQAAKKVAEAERYSLGRKFTKAQQDQLDAAAERVTLMINTRKALEAIERARNSGTNVAAKRAFSKKEIEFAVKQFQAGKGTRITGSLNEVREILDSNGNKFIVKRVTDADEATTEVAASLLANRIGLNAPRAHAIKVGSGSSAEYLLMSRSIKEGADGVALKLSKATEPVAVALKEDYARQRVFRAWLGDSDGHLGNQLFAADGRLWQIDFGMGSFKIGPKGFGGKPKHFREKVGFTTDADFLQAVVGVPHGRSAIPKNRTGKFEDLVSMERFLEVQVERGLPYQWMVRMDEMLHLDQMRDTVDEIVKLTAAEDGKVLKKLLRDAGYPHPDTAFKVLENRATALEAVLENRFGKAIQTGAHLLPGLLDPLRPMEESIDWMRMAA